MTVGGHVIKRNKDTADATSTSNLKAHALKCFGEDAVTAAMDVKNLKAARDVMKDKVSLRRSGSIAVAFQRAGTEKITYSTTPATTLEVRANHVRWMCESKRPFAIAKDGGYHRNMKIGWPHQYIPSPETISRDVRVVFVEARKHMSRLLKVRQITPMSDPSNHILLTRRMTADSILQQIAGLRRIVEPIWLSPFNLQPRELLKSGC